MTKEIDYPSLSPDQINQAQDIIKNSLNQPLDYQPQTKSELTSPSNDPYQEFLNKKNQTTTITIPSLPQEPKPNPEYDQMMANLQDDLAHQKAHPETKSPQITFGKKLKMAIAGALVAVGLGGAVGCEAQTPPSAIESPAPTDSSAHTPLPSVVEVIPSPTVEATQSPSPIENVNLAEIRADLEDSPEIEGLTFKIVEENGTLEGIYYYEAGNPYGGIEGEKAGERVLESQVTVEGQEVGGLCLNANVCEKLLKDELNKIPEGQDKLKVILPLDISNYNGEVKISNENLIGDKTNKEYTYIKVVCLASVPVVNIIPDVTLLNSASGGHYNNNSLTLGGLMDLDAYQNFDPNLAYLNIGVFSNGNEFPERDGCSNIFYGSKLVDKNTDSTIYLEFAAPDRVELTVDSLLVVDGKPIFIVAEEPKTS